MFELHAAKGTSCTQRDAPDGTLREAILCRSRDAPDGTLAAFFSHTRRSLLIRPAQMAGPRQVGPTRLAVERAPAAEGHSLSSKLSGTFRTTSTVFTKFPGVRC